MWVCWLRRPGIGSLSRSAGPITVGRYHEIQLFEAKESMCVCVCVCDELLL